MFNLKFDAGKSASFDLSADQVATLANNHEVLSYIMGIGLSNILKDSYASIKSEDFKTEDEWRAAQRDKASLKLGALMAGEVRSQSNERKPRVDDFTNAARKLVLSLLSKEKRKELAETEDKGAAVLDAIFAKNEAKLRPQVEAAIEKARAEAEAKKSLSDGLDLSI